MIFIFIFIFILIFYIYSYFYIYVNLHLYIFFYIVTSIIYLYLCLLLFIYIYIYMCVCVCVYVYGCMYIFFTHTQIYIYIYTLYTRHSLSSETVHPQHFFSIGKTHGHGQAALCPPPVQPTAPAPRRSTSAQGARGWAPAPRTPEAGRGRGDRCPRRCLKGGSLREADELGSWDLLLVIFFFWSHTFTHIYFKLVTIEVLWSTQLVLPKWSPEDKITVQYISIKCLGIHS